MDTVLPASEVSAQHAVLTWSGAGWTVRDLASRNGTVCNGRRLEAGWAEALTKGAVLEFGSPAQRFVLIDDRPPAPRGQLRSTDRRW